jgi:hypothetical protein
MTPRHGKKFHKKSWFLAMRSAAAALLSVAVVFSAFGGAKAQVVAVDPVLPCCPFQKQAGFYRQVNVNASEKAQSVSQSYYDLIRKYDPFDPDPNKIPILLSEIQYGLDASLAQGSGHLYNSISSLPFWPGGPVFRGTTNILADYTEPGKSLVASERFSFSGFEGNVQEGSAILVGMRFNTELIQGNAFSHAEFDTVTRQFEGSYLGEGIGAAGIGIDIGAVSGESGVNSSSQSYSGSISVKGDYRIMHSVSGGPPGACFWGW